jgi:hypothetical protein
MKHREEADHSQTQRPGVANVPSRVRIEESLVGKDISAERYRGGLARVQTHRDSCDGSSWVGSLRRRAHIRSAHARTRTGTSIGFGWNAVYSSLLKTAALPLRQTTMT